MARTRTSDPGRVPAPHYAATDGQRHAKPRLYAYLATAAAWARLGLTIVGLWGFSPGMAQAQGNVPCAACQVLSLAPDQAALMPDRLDSARVLVRVAPGSDAWVAALRLLRERGGRAGLHVLGMPADNNPLLGAEAD